jgi:hypothetical protein
MSEYQLVESKCGPPTLEITENGKKLKLHSAFDPVKEGERSTSSFKTAPGRIVIVAGAGLGYHIDQLSLKYPENPMIIIEQDRRVLDILRKERPSSLSRAALVSSIEDITPLLESMDIGKIKGSDVFFHRQSYQRCPAFYDTIIKDISQYISSKISDLLTRFEFEEKWVENILENITSLPRAHSAGAFFGRFKECPGVIVSAGPSLKDSLEDIRAIKDKALIVAVDTAYKVLLQAGIEPHIVMVLDAQKQSLYHFMGTPKTKSVLLADIVSSPKVIHHTELDIFFSTTTKYYDTSGGDLARETTPFVDWLEKHIAPLGDIQSGGSVATSVFDFLLNCGCPEIILVGQDLAYTGRKIHSTGTHHNEKWIPALSRFQTLESINQNIVRKRRIKYVPEVHGHGTVLTDFVLDLYRGWFNDSAGKVNIPVLNGSSGGAMIENAPAINIISHFDNKMPVNPAKTIGELIQKSPLFKVESLKKALLESTESIKKIKDDLEKGDPRMIYLFIEKSDLKAIYAPFLKKTLTYLSRHSMDRERSDKLLLDELRRSSNKIITLFDRAVRSLSK